MKTKCSSTPQAISGVLLAGDVLLNLSDQTLNVTAGTRFISESRSGFAVSPTSGRITWRPEHADRLSTLASGEFSRIVVVAEEDCAEASKVLGALAAKQIPHVYCALLTDCDAESFMDEEDAEAVTERLRQLGYI